MVEIMVKRYDIQQTILPLPPCDTGDTISHFYNQSKKFTPITSKSTTVQAVDNFLDRLIKLTEEDDQINNFFKNLKTLTPGD
ncbi:unnamed protein product [Ceutorhynchus assimilis]|uniref:Uncharacterized protein n=1 Tax=Ceutorhynchus assimilis TaxID=467358 RepID=A0A9N9QDD0_9CUCU|nr:unnamed protein product [Ceutorhynchus assimilis]